MQPTSNPHKGNYFSRNFRSNRPNWPPKPNDRNPRRRSNNKRQIGENIDISKFVQKSSECPAEIKTPITNTFADFNLNYQIIGILKKRNYTTPTPIQDQSIKPIMKGRDLTGLANTGTGKTAAFLLPLIDKVIKQRNQKVLIIAPTRELTQQIEDEFRQFSRNMGILSITCIGGASMSKQICNLTRRPNFVIGTPGRLKDLGKRGKINFAMFNNVVIDEIDRMMDMGFINDIKEILSQVPKDRQTLFFSATMPPKIRDLVTEFQNNPVTIEVSSGQTAKNVDQDIVKFKHKSTKFDHLQDVLNHPEAKKVLIFSETKQDVEKLTNELLESGYKADSIHGNKRQSQRQRSLARFKDNITNILVATDVAARGLDIKDISHVINYTLPHTYEDYIHRIGRTGRGDKKGMALTFVQAKF